MEKQKLANDKSDIYQLKDLYKKQSITFKSTIDVFLKIFEDLLINPIEKKNNMTLISGTPIFDQTDLIDYLNIEEKSNIVLKEIQGLLLRNLTYINNTFKLDLFDEIQKVRI